MRRANYEAAGHSGVRKTLEQLRRRAFWKGWRGDVEQYFAVARYVVVITGEGHLVKVGCRIW